jgi:hypothetical protein
VSDGTAACFNDHHLRSAFIGRYFVMIASKGLGRFYWYGWDYVPEHDAFSDVTAGLLPEAGAYTPDAQLDRERRAGPVHCDWPALLLSRGL